MCFVGMSFIELGVGVFELRKLLYLPQEVCRKSVWQKEDIHKSGVWEAMWICVCTARYTAIRRLLCIWVVSCFTCVALGQL
jgi:hypothetical protein